MESLYVKTHWDAFVETINNHHDQEATGQKPSDWGNKYKLDGIPQGLPDKKLGRAEVLGYCRDKPDVLFGYICAMAWGGQGMGPAGSRHPKSSWAQSQKLIEPLEKLRTGGLTRCEAYKLFLGKENWISGLGPAFWTKLLYFFGPKDEGLPYSNDSKNCYIMDQWTARSVNLLTGLQVVKMDGDSVSRKNKCGNYQAFCEEIDRMAKTLNEQRVENVTGAKVEEWLFSEGGKWREYVKQHSYNPDLLRARYPHIKDCF